MEGKDKRKIIQSKKIKSENVFKKLSKDEKK